MTTMIMLSLIDSVKIGEITEVPRRLYCFNVQSDVKMYLLDNEGADEPFAVRTRRRIFTAGCLRTEIYQLTILYKARQTSDYFW